MNGFNKELRDNFVGFKVTDTERKRLEAYAKKHKTTISKVMYKSVIDVIGSK